MVKRSSWRVRRRCFRQRTIGCLLIFRSTVGLTAVSGIRGFARWKPSLLN